MTPPLIASCVALFSAVLLFFLITQKYKKLGKAHLLVGLGSVAIVLGMLGPPAPLTAWIIYLPASVGLAIMFLSILGMITAKPSNRPAI